VEIECTPDYPGRHSIPSQAFLIASWLASRLKWRPTSKPQWSGEQAYHLGLASEHGPITIRIKTTPCTEGAQGGLNALRLVVESEPSARFVVSCCDDTSYLQTTVELAGTKVDRRVFPLGDQREAELVSKELEILGHDAVFEQALAFFAGVRIQG
jgi:glucose-6-phosphate dehydrogenase assembly protein OpcA